MPVTLQSIKFVLVSLTIASVLVVWFKTYALEEYLGLFRIKWFHKLIKLTEYHKLEVEARRGFHLFLLEYHPCFLSRLVTCPVCIAMWLGIAMVYCFPWPLATSFTGLFLYKLYCRLFD